MSHESEPTPARPQYQSRLGQEVEKKAGRKLKARRDRDRSIWFGLGMFGLVGWSIAIPTLIGIAVGVWIDRTWDRPYSGTLMCLFIGVVTGCAIAWYWVKRESLAAAESDNDDLHVSDTQQQGTRK